MILPDGFYASAVLAVAGACIGSFLNVVIYRLPRGVSVVWPASACPRCGRPLRWRHLVPLASYVWLRGRCAGCREPISPAYPLVEAATAAVLVLLLHVDGLSPGFVRHAALALLLIPAAEIDRRHGVIPNRLLAVGACAGLGVACLPGGPGLVRAVPAALGSAGVLLLLRVGSRRVTGRPGMGMGDVKLAATTALFLGWDNLWVFYLAAVLGAAFGLAGLWSGRLERGTRLPFAPFVAAGAVLHVLGVSPFIVLRL